MSNVFAPSISVALCTFNGESYLPAQWQSLLEQQKLPDEVVVCDDRSTDNTLKLLHELAAISPFKVNIYSNDTQLGYNKNFERALSLCTGELIFICDQDDYWFPEKIAKMSHFMQQHPTIQLAFCDAFIANADLQSTGNRFWNWIRFGKTDKQRWKSGLMMDVMLEGNRIMGCATVLRKRFLSEALPFPDVIPSNYIYDGWLGLVGAAYENMAFIDEAMQLYRTHDNQQVGIRDDSDRPTRVRILDRLVRDRDQKLAPIQKKQQRLLAVYEQLSERLPQHLPGMADLRHRLQHFSMRSTLPANRLYRIKPVFSDLLNGNYHRHREIGADWKGPFLAFLGDLLE